MAKRSDPVPAEFVVTSVGSVRTTRDGNSYLSCDTSLGKVAFRGNERDSRNIDRVRGLRTPASLRCGCIPSNWLQFARWIPQGAEVEILAPGREVAGGAAPAAASVAAPVVTADELSAWRRRLLRILDTLEDSAARSEGAIARITL